MSNRAALVWVRLTECYGQQFVQQFGETPSEMWVAAIDSLPDYKITYALQQVAKHCRDFPPSLPKFVGYANDAPTPPPAGGYLQCQVDYARRRRMVEDMKRVLKGDKPEGPK